MQGPGSLKKRRIAVLGSRCVGKSSLVLQFVGSQFVDLYYPTIENTHTKIVEYDGATYECTIIDTAGQDEFSILNEKYVIGIHGYVLVYSITSEPSFDMVKIVHDKIIELWGLMKVPVVLVGQKSDFPLRKVSTAQAQMLAEKLGCPCIETSARDNLNIGKVFELCLAEIEKKHRRPVAQLPARNRCTVM